MRNNFIGKWTLEVEKSVYEFGNPPLQATYEMIDSEDDSLNIKIEWKDDKGESLNISYKIIPDGTKRKYAYPDVADELMSEFGDDQSLTTKTFKNDVLISVAIRTIESSGMMKVEQIVKLEDGTELKNIQFYKK